MKWSCRIEPEKCTIIGAALMPHLKLVVQNLSETGNLECVVSLATFCSAEIKAGASTE